jgi:hypothetical protein
MKQWPEKLQGPELELGLKRVPVRGLRSEGEIIRKVAGDFCGKNSTGGCGE